MVELAEQIIASRRRGHKLLALLIDPDKPQPFAALPYLNGQVDYIFNTFTNRTTYCTLSWFGSAI